MCATSACGNGALTLTIVTVEGGSGGIGKIGPRATARRVRFGRFDSEGVTRCSISLALWRVQSVSFSFPLIAHSLCQLGSIHNKLCPRNNGPARANIANIVHKFACTKFAFPSVRMVVEGGRKRGGLEGRLCGQEKRNIWNIR